MKNFLLSLIIFSILLSPETQAAGKKTSNAKDARKAEKRNLNALKIAQEAYLNRFRLEVASGNGQFGNAILNIPETEIRYKNIEDSTNDLFNDLSKYEIPFCQLYTNFQKRIWKVMAMKYFDANFFSGIEEYEMKRVLERASQEKDAIFFSKKQEIRELLQVMYQNEDFINPLPECYKINHKFFKYFMEEPREKIDALIENDRKEYDQWFMRVGEVHRQAIIIASNALLDLDKVAFRLIFCNSLFFAKKYPDLFQITVEEKKKLDHPLFLEYFELNKKIFLYFREHLDVMERYFNAIYFSQRYIVQNKLFLESEVLVNLPDLEPTLALPQPLKNAIERVAQNLFSRKKAEQERKNSFEEEQRVYRANLKKQKKDQKYSLVKDFNTLSLSEEEKAKLYLDDVDAPINRTAVAIEMEEKERSRLQEIVTLWINSGKWSNEGFNIVKGAKLALNKERVLDHVGKHFIKDSEMSTLLGLDGLTLNVCKDRTKNEDLLEFLRDEDKLICSSFVVSGIDSFEQYLEALLKEEHATHQEEGKEILTFSKPIPILNFRKYKNESMSVEYLKTNTVYVHYNHRKEMSTLYPKVN